MLACITQCRRLEMRLDLSLEDHNPPTPIPEPLPTHHASSELKFSLAKETHRPKPRMGRVGVGLARMWFSIYGTTTALMSSPHLSIRAGRLGGQRAGAQRLRYQGFPLQLSPPQLLTVETTTPEAKTRKARLLLLPLLWGAPQEQAAAGRRPPNAPRARKAGIRCPRRRFSALRGHRSVPTNDEASRCPVRTACFSR